MAPRMSSILPQPSRTSANSRSSGQCQCEKPERKRSRIIPTAERQQYEFLQTGLLWGAMGMWLTSALVAGTGVAFWVFDPMTGRVRPSLKAD